MTEASKEEIYRAKMNLETAQIAWKELQRFFASGAAIHVSETLDLVEVAYQISEDNADQIRQWMDQGLLGKVTDEEAQSWWDSDAVMWAVVVSPYVLVQATGSVH